MGNRLLFFLEFFIVITLFAFLASFVITTHQNEVVVDQSEDFIELVRYKGCVTGKMYDDFLQAMPCPVKVSFIVQKGTTLELTNTPANKEFTQEVFDSIESKGYFPLTVGDEVQIVVRKTSPNYFDETVGLLTGTGPNQSMPIIAIKGGLVLNEQYH